MRAPLPDSRRQAAHFWPRVWIYTGLSADIPEPGDILPFTIAEAGLHVERLADGTLEARVNRAQQGGCLVIPQQCHGGTQLRCPQAACAFSRDRLATIDATTPERERLLWQFVGNRPDRLARIALREDSGFVRIRITGEDDEAGEAGPGFASGAHRSWWTEVGTPWHDLAQHLFLAALAEGWTGSLHFPNLVRLAGQGWQAAIILQPLGPDLTRCRIASAGAQAEGHRAVQQVIDRAARQSGQASADVAVAGTGLSLHAAIMRVCEASPASPLGRRARGRLNPSYGFVGT